MNQLEVIKATRDQYEESMNEHSKLSREISEMNAKLGDEIRELEERVNHVNAKKQIGLSRTEESSRAIRVFKAAHEAQFNKIFKRWEE